MWTTIADFIKRLFGLAGESRREYRADFDSVANQWEKLASRMETRLTIVEKKYEECEAHHQECKFSVQVLSDEVARLRRIITAQLETDDDRVRILKRVANVEKKL